MNPEIILETDPKKLTAQLLSGVEVAKKIGHSRAATVLTDMSNSLARWGKLTAGQQRYAKSLLQQCSPKAIDESLKWESDWHKDEQRKADAKVVAHYYLKNPPYYSDVATQILADRAPDMRKYKSMMANEYAKKVLESSKKEPLWKAGDLVQLRSTARGRIKYITNPVGEYYAARSKVYSAVYTVLAVDSIPIDAALKYKEKTGGCRYYRLLPLGSATMIDAMECDLKKAQKKLINGGK